MKYSFSKNQKFPLYYGVIDVLICALLFISALFYYPEKNGGFIFVCVASFLFILFGIFGILMFSLTFHPVIFREDGVSIETKKGKKIRFIEWKDVKIYTVTKDSQYGEQYICLSANENLNPLRTRLFGVVWTIFYDKNSIALPTDYKMIAYCDSHLAEYGIKVKFT